MGIKTMPKSKDPFVVKMVDLVSIKDFDRNAKIHTEEQVDSIVRSIAEFGFRDPIAIDSDGVLVEGHGRVLAMRKMGRTQIPALVFSDMTYDQVSAYRIAHNQLTLSTGFNLDLLGAEISDLQSSGFALDVLGFSGSELDFMLPEEVKEYVPAPVEETEEFSEKEPTFSAVAPVYKYTIIFDSVQQRDAWNTYLHWLRDNVEGVTIATRIVNHLTKDKS